MITTAPNLEKLARELDEYYPQECEILCSPWTFKWIAESCGTIVYQTAYIEEYKTHIFVYFSLIQDGFMKANFKLIPNSEIEKGKVRIRRI